MRRATCFAVGFVKVLLGAGWVSATAEGGHGEGGSILPLIWHLLNFAILMVALYYLFGKKLVGFFAARREQIERAIREARQMRQEAERRYQDCEARLKGVDQEVAQLRQEAEKDMEELRRRLQAEAQAAEQKILQQTRQNIEQEAKKARNALQAEAALLAISLAEEALKKNINLEDQQRLFREYLANIGDSNWSGRS